MSDRRRPKFGSGEIIVLIVIGVFILIVISGWHRTILDALYSPFSVVVALVMVVEYLLLKGSDRSQIYRRERDAARAIRRDDLLAMREMESLLVDLRARLAPQLERDPEAAVLREALGDAQATTGRVVEIMRSRV
jgi:hypothetical protein